MKFTNGYWLTQPGVKALYARQDYEIAVTRDGKGIEILAPAASVHGRADTLNLPTFDVTITSPARGVIRIRARHWDGQNDIPGFPLNGDQPDKQPRGQIGIRRKKQCNQSGKCKKSQNPADSGREQLGKRRFKIPERMGKQRHHGLVQPK